MSELEVKQLIVEFPASEHEKVIKALAVKGGWQEKVRDQQGNIFDNSAKPEEIAIAVLNAILTNIYREYEVGLAREAAALAATQEFDKKLEVPLFSTKL